MVVVAKQQNMGCVRSEPPGKKKEMNRIIRVAICEHESAEQTSQPPAYTHYVELAGGSVLQMNVDSLCL